MLQHALQVADHLGVRKAKNAPANGLDVSGSRGIDRLSPGMRIAIHLDNQHRRPTRKVGDIRPDHRLSPEFEITEAGRAQLMSQPRLGGRHLGAQALGVRE